MPYTKQFFFLLQFLLVAIGTAFAQNQDPGWPRTNAQPAGTVISYQPQVDDWKDFTTITRRQAFQLPMI